MASHRHGATLHRRAAANDSRVFTFISPMGLPLPMTRDHAKLLGPCFKTGQMIHLQHSPDIGGTPHAAQPTTGTLDKSSARRADRQRK
jgi:hypothetical protein